MTTTRIVLLLAGVLITAGGRGGAVLPGDQWQAAAPGEAGMDSTLLARARDYAMGGGGSGIFANVDAMAR